MTETIEGGGAPLPPKRPTIIRAKVVTSDADGGAPIRPAPARPAPPPPVRPAPPQIKIASHQEQDDDGDPSPRRPMSTSDNSSSWRSGGSVKKRPEITIVGAQPMSQVGFRDEIHKDEKEHHTSPPTSKPPDIPPMRGPPPRPVSLGRPPAPPSRPVVDEDCNNLLSPSISPPPVPSLAPSSQHPPRPSRPKSFGNADLNNASDTKYPGRPPRSPIPSPAPRQRTDGASLMQISTEQTEQDEQQKQPVRPSRPSRPTIIRPKRPQRTTNTEEKDGSGNQGLSCDTTPSLIPLPADGGELFAADDAVQDGGASESPASSKPQITHIIKTCSDQDKKIDAEVNDSSAEPLYAVINKKRPTSFPKPKISPREEKVGADATPADDHALPFKVKLRSTIEKKPDKESSDDGAPDRSSTDVSSKLPPPLAAKPKPLPKPKPAAKPSKQESWADKIKDFDSLVSGPSSTKKNISPSTTKKDIGTDSSRKDVSPSNTKKYIGHSNIKKESVPSTTKNDSDIDDYEKESSGVVFPNQIVVKRPTIIRPPAKPARVSQEDVDEKVAVNGQTRHSPDSSDETKAGPPLPARRPVSQAAAMFEQASEVKEESLSKPQVLKKMDVEEKSGSNDSVLGGKQNQGPSRPTKVPVPRTRKTPSDIAEVKSFPEKQSPLSEDKSSTEPVEKESPSTCENLEQAQQHPSRPSGRPPPPKFSTTQKTVTKDTDISEAVKGPPRPSGGPPRPAGPPSSPKTSQPGRPSPPRSSAQKHTTKVQDLPNRPSPGHPLYHYMMHEPHGIAQFDYTATQDDEITFTTGDTILLERRIDADWLVGRVGAKSGMFPAEFVHVVHPLQDEMSSEAQAAFVDSLDSAQSYHELPKQTRSYDELPKQTQSYHDLQEQTQSYVPVTSGPRCIARFDFEGEGTDDLSFEEDDVIRLISTMGCDWMRGELRGREGIFPIAFVDILEPLPDDAYRPDSFFVTMESDHVGKEEQELSFKAGETIKLLGRLDSFWLIGETNTEEGKFPASLVTTPLPPELPDYEPPADLVEDQQPEREILSKGPSSSDGQPFALAVHHFNGEQNGDLTFEEGDRIELLERVGQDWYKGRLHGNEGMFPASFVDVHIDIPELSSPDPPSSYKTPDSPSGYMAQDSPSGYMAPDHPLSVIIKGKALYDFDGQGSEELTFKTGDMIILEEHVSDGSDWQYGTLDGKRGMFPASFIEIL